MDTRDSYQSINQIDMRIGGDTKETEKKQKTMIERIRANREFASSPRERKYYALLEEWAVMDTAGLRKRMHEYKDKKTGRYDIERMMIEHYAMTKDGAVYMHTDSTNTVMRPLLFEIINERLEDWQRDMGKREYAEKKRLEELGDKQV
ncbi:hypothetical protein KAU11_10375 [Candidatus Babeliales bacterium]|nr:hypothetical protein [Candidatus Babeliales bacterium]